MERIEQEIWKDIEGYEGVYQVSSYGRLMKLRREWKGGNGGKRVSAEKIMNPHYSKFGYNHQTFILNGKPKDLRACRLVAKAFIPNPENKPFVNHKDGNKANDYYKNLEWATRSENDIHAFRTGLRTGMKGSKNGMARISEDVVLKIRGEYAGGRYAELAKKYNLSPDAVGSIIRRDSWRHI